MTDKLVDSLLTLFNEYGEKYEAGPMTTYVKSGSKLRMRWTCNEPMGNVSPFTHAILHSAKSVVRLSTIRPFAPGADPKEIELEFGI
jgi:hypothetical protein